MSSSNVPLSSYLKQIRAQLEQSLCIRNFASESVERHNKPEIEMHPYTEDNYIILPPVLISKNTDEKCLIESSINSIRISISIKKSDEIESVLVDRLCRFIEQRADEFSILRRIAVVPYDISFLITNTHIDEMIKDKLIDYIIQFIEDINSEVSTLKLNVNSRARVVAHTFLSQFI